MRSHFDWSPSRLASRSRFLPVLLLSLAASMTVLSFVTAALAQGAGTTVYTPLIKRGSVETPGPVGSAPGDCLSRRRRAEGRTPHAGGRRPVRPYWRRAAGRRPTPRGPPTRADHAGDHPAGCAPTRTGGGVVGT